MGGFHPEVGAFAEVSWEQLEAGEVSVEFQLDETWYPTPSKLREPGMQTQLVAGIPYGETVEWRIVTPRGAVVGATPISTEAVPEGLPLGRVEAAMPTGWLSEGNYLLTSISETGNGWGTDGPFWTVIYDRRGRPVWAHRTPRRNVWTLYATVARSGDRLLIDEFDRFDIATATLLRTYLDAEIDEMPIPGFHHAFVEMPDGAIAWGSKVHGGGEALVQADWGSTEVEILWTCQDDWPEGYARGCTSNCVYYHDASDTFLYSFYTNQSVVEIDNATGQTLWWAGTVDDGYAFVPNESQFIWQHGVSWTDEGTLLLSTHDFRNEATNYAREYRVDRKAGTLTQIWEYDALGFAYTNGDAWRLSNGNTLHTMGSDSYVKEVNLDGDVVWHLDFDENNQDRLMGRSEWIDDPLLLAVARGALVALLAGGCPSQSSDGRGGEDTATTTPIPTITEPLTTGDTGGFADLSCVEGKLGPGAPVTGTTQGKGDDVSAFCGGGGAEDATYTLAASSTGLDYVIVVDAAFDSVLRVASSCTGAEITCADVPGTGEMIRLGALPTDDLVVSVDGFQGEGGDFTLSVIEVQPNELDCTDGLDDDLDGSIDCDDPDCQQLKECLPECPLFEAGALPLNLKADTTALEDQFNPPCVGALGAPEATWRFVAPAAGTYRFTTVGSDFDTVLYALDGCLGGSLGCNDDIETGNLQSAIELQLQADQEIILVVDGYATNAGNVVLTGTAL